ncbi:MAG: hypothetical protein ABIP39_13575 [Polyangiaceae bacterium]
MGAPIKKERSLKSIRSPVPIELDDLLDQIDVPAAVVCARCGSAECLGCSGDDFSRSGVIAIIAWERSDAPLFRRLWMTARATTREAETFFEALPDGPIAPALRFAIVSELIATSVTLLLFLPFVVIGAPHWAKDVLLSGAAFRALIVGIPAFAAILVLAHAAHGVSLDIGARRGGGGLRAQRSRALRFGLYATGWDLVIGPVGTLMIALNEGLFSAFQVPTMASGLPTRSARAFLRGAYGLYGSSADKAVRTSYIAAIGATGFAAVAVVVAVVAAIVV